MKQLLAAFLCLCALFSLFSCSSGITLDRTEAETVTETEQDVSVLPEIPSPLTREAIDAIPVATGEMTADRLRQICLDYFRLQLTFLWTPSETFSYEVESQDKFPVLKAGEVYAGLPYDSGAGNLYKIMKYYDSQTGVVKVTGQRGEDFSSMIGNQCSYGSFWGWARVANSMTFGLTHSMTASAGAIPVGPYRYDTSIKSFQGHPTREICDRNGEQVMYQSYAALLPADGVVHYNDGGHVQMIVKSVPVYRKDGTIDGKESYAIILEQGSTWEAKADGDLSYSVQGGVDRKVRYETFFKEGYLPFTLAEFIGLDPVEAPTTSLGLEGDRVTAEALARARVTSNYTISDITVKVASPEGETLYSYTGFGNNVHCYRYDMHYCAFPPSLKPYADGKNRVSVECRIGTGAILTLYRGVLIPSK